MLRPELIDYFRQLSGDTELDYVCSEALANSFADEAEREAFERSLFGRLDGGYDVSIVAGTATYTLDPLIIFIERALISGEDYPLAKTTKRELDFNISDWANADQDTPKYYFQIESKITLYPTPIANGTLLLDGFRRPAQEMETPSELHESLVYWMLYRHYSINDIEAYNPQKAEMYMNKFSDVFGHKRGRRFDEHWRNGSTYSPMYVNPFS